MLALQASHGQVLISLISGDRLNTAVYLYASIPIGAGEIQAKKAAGKKGRRQKRGSDRLFSIPEAKCSPQENIQRFVKEVHVVLAGSLQRGMFNRVVFNRVGEIDDLGEVSCLAE